LCCGALLVTLFAVSCSSAPAPKTTIAEPSGPGGGAPTSGDTATAITALSLREGAPGVLVDVSASGPLVWTSYRDADGGLVVELPNTVPAPSLQSLAPESGMVATVAVRQDTTGDRPLTRITVTGREEFEYNLSSEDSTLQLRLTPVSTSVAAVAEPLPPAEAVAPAAPAPAGDRQARFAGTPDQPVTGLPAGRPATCLQRIEVGPNHHHRRRRRVRLFHFRLESDRFVIDLQDGQRRRSARHGSSQLRRTGARRAPSPPRRRAWCSISRPPLTGAAPDRPGLEGAGAGEPTLAEQLSQSPRREEPPAAGGSRPGRGAAARRARASRRQAGWQPATALEAADVREEPATTAAVAAAPGIYAPQPLGEKATKYVGEPMSLHLKDADIGRCDRSADGLNVVVQPGVAGTVTVELENVPGTRPADDPQTTTWACSSRTTCCARAAGDPAARGRRGAQLRRRRPCRCRWVPSCGASARRCAEHFQHPASRGGPGVMAADERAH
jgi:hypothetical protein